MKPERVSEHFVRKLKDPYFKKLYEFEEQKLQIVKKIINYRLQNNLTQGQLAQKAGVSQQHISKIEKGEFSNISTLNKILVLIGYIVRLEVLPLSRSTAQKIEKHRRAA